MDRFIFITACLASYILGVIVSQKTKFVVLWLMRILSQPVEMLKGWFDIIFAILALSFLGYLAHYWWPLSNEHSQVLIFSVTALTLFFQAIIGDRPYKYRNRSKIKVNFDINEADNYHMTTNYLNINMKSGVSIVNPISTYYVRLRIENVGKTTLQNVQVVLRRILEGKPKNPFFPLNLRWSFEGEITSIPPYEASKTIDLFEIPNSAEVSFMIDELDLKGGVADRERYVQQAEGFRACSVYPNTLTDIFPAGEYIFQILISAENAESRIAKIFIGYDKGWAKNTTIEEMRTKYLKVKLLS